MNRFISILFFSFIMIFLIHSMSMAETGDSDLFDDLLTDTEPEKEENIFSQLSKNFSGNTNFRYSWFFDTLTVDDPLVYGEPDDQLLINDVQCSLADFILNDFGKFYFEMLLMVGNQKDTYKPALSDAEDYSWEEWLRNRDRRRINIEMRELYMSFYLGNVDITIGKKIFSNTLSSIYTPADMYYIRDYNDPFLINKSGTLICEADVYFSTLTLNLVLFPVHEIDKQFSLLSRWSYYTFIDTTIPGDITFVYDNFPEISIGNMGYLGRLKGTLFHTDFFLSAYHGLSKNLVYKIIEPLPALHINEEVTKVFNTTLGFSTVIDKFEFHGEGLYNLSYESKDDDFIRYVGGFRYKVDFFPTDFFIDDVEITSEYAGEILLNRQSKEDYVLSSENKRLFKNDILINFLIRIGEKWKTNIMGQYEIDGESFILRGNTEYAGLYDFTFGIACEFFFVQEQSDYYNWRHNSRILASITYSF